MTEGRVPAHGARRRPRISKRMLRAWAWIAGGTALFAPLGALAAQPKVATPSAASAGRPVIVKQTIRRVILVSPRMAASPQRVVYVGGGTSAGGSAPAPVTATGGSAPPP
jgi:hypothetical protein